MAQQTPPWELRRYFVDEAGDPVLFNRYGHAVIGQPGCSRHFLMGFVEVDDEDGLAARLSALRQALATDPSTRDLASMRPEARRTTVAFHANKDHPLVRRRVVDLLVREGFRFYAVVKDKARVLEDLRATQRLIPTYRYSQNGLYDAMVSRLFRDRLHADHCDIVFARRGASDRTEALRNAIEDAKARFQDKWARPVERRHAVTAAVPQQFGGLQAADYCLWALQRLIERNEEDDWRRLAGHSVEVVALDKGPLAEGRSFSASRPLNLRSWIEAPGI
jgi:hypothetical protein